MVPVLGRRVSGAGGGRQLRAQHLCYDVVRGMTEAALRGLWEPRGGDSASVVVQESFWGR